MVSIINQINADKHNIQVMVDLIPFCTSKGEFRSLQATIKVLVKEIHNAKCLLEEKAFHAKDKIQIPLFEVEPSPVTILEEYKELSSYFGNMETC